MTLKQFLDEFIDFEKENDLLSWNIDSIPIWELVRFRVFMNLRHHLVSEAISVGDRTTHKILRGFKNFLLNSFLNNPMIRARQSKILIFCHPRRKLDNEFYTDIYSDLLLEKLDSKEYLVLERFHNLNHLQPTATSNIFYLDYLEFPSRIVSGLFSSKVAKRQKLIIKDISRKIRENWNLDDFYFEKEVNRAVTLYKFLYPKLYKLIKRINPQVIINVVSYSIINQIVTSIAKENRIPVVELQHGTVGRYHIGCNYPEGVNVYSFPDYFFAWGQTWVKNARLPIPKTCVYDIGFAYIDQFNTIDHSDRIQDQIIFISQLREDLAVFANRVALQLPQYRFSFKAHPREYSIASEKYSNILSAPNMKLIDFEVSLYDLFKRSTFVFGVNSTALIEALAFGPKVGVIKLPGWEYFEDLENSESLHFISNVRDAKDLVLYGGQMSKTNIDRFFKPNAQQNFMNAIKHILIPTK